MTTTVSRRWAAFNRYSDLAFAVRRSHGGRFTLGSSFLIARANASAPRGVPGFRKADLEYRLRLCAAMAIGSGC